MPTRPRPGRRRASRTSVSVLRRLVPVMLLACACEGQPPLPAEASAIRDALAQRFATYRQATPGFEAAGRLLVTRADGTKAEVDWQIAARHGEFTELHFRAASGEEPLASLRGTAEAAIPT